MKNETKQNGRCYLKEEKESESAIVSMKMREKNRFVSSSPPTLPLSAFYTPTLPFKLLLLERLPTHTETNTHATLTHADSYRLH